MRQWVSFTRWLAHSLWVSAIGWLARKIWVSIPVRLLFVPVVRRYYMLFIMPTMCNTPRVGHRQPVNLMGNLPEMAQEQLYCLIPGHIMAMPFGCIRMGILTVSLPLVCILSIFCFSPIERFPYLKTQPPAVLTPITGKTFPSFGHISIAIIVPTHEMPPTRYGGKIPEFNLVIDHPIALDRFVAAWAPEGFILFHQLFRIYRPVQT